MVDTGIYATTTMVQYKAGTYASTTSNSETYINSFMAQAESLINVTCRKVFAVDAAAFTALPASTKSLLSEVASNLAAIYVIKFDMSGFTSRGEAEDMINVLRDGALRGLSILRDKKVQDFLMTGNATTGGG